MVSFNKFFSSVFLAIVYASIVRATPQTFAAAEHETRRSRHVGRGLSLESFHPPTTYKTFGAGIEQPASLDSTTIEDSAVAVVQSQLGVTVDDVVYKSGYSSGSTKYAYVRQHHNGVPFANAVANIAWKDNRVVSFGSSFVKKTRIAPSRPTVDVKSIIPKAEEALDGKYNNHPATLEYLARPDGSVALVHVVQIQNEETGTWYEAFVDDHSGTILSVTDFVSDASYTVLPITKETLSEGLETLLDPQDTLASPAGWHTVGSTSTITTAGNNVVAYKSSRNATTSQSSAGFNFNYSYNTTQAPTVQVNVDTARVNAFYTINTVHDFAYRYGFTEKAFNFQSDNFGKGGEENDRVLMSVQETSGTDNANFATPPDGQSGICRMYVWTYTTPGRDGDLENDIIVHEMTHGITDRMTGGGTGRCLQTTEAGGMGEGWSDALAEWTEQKSSVISDYVLGAYVTNKPKGIRKYPYSTSAKTNPPRYSSIKTLNEVHNIGEVWANMLHNVYAALVTQYGFSSTAKTNPDGIQGNIVYLHLFLDALSLQPCNLTFVSARDAWIQADANRYGGVKKCLLWKAFASRGLGVKAAGYVDDSSVPAGC